MGCILHQFFAKCLNWIPADRQTEGSHLFWKSKFFSRFSVFFFVSIHRAVAVIIVVCCTIEEKPVRNHVEMVEFVVTMVKTSYHFEFEAQMQTQTDVF